MNRFLKTATFITLVLTCFSLTAMQKTQADILSLELELYQAIKDYNLNNIFNALEKGAPVDVIRCPNLEKKQAPLRLAALLAFRNDCRFPIMDYLVQRGASLTGVVDLIPLSILFGDLQLFLWLKRYRVIQNYENALAYVQGLQDALCPVTTLSKIYDIMVSELQQK